MGMSTHAVGIVEPDEKWLKMKAAWEACKMAGVEPPKEVFRYFDGGEPDETQTVDIKSSVEEWSNDYASGLVVDLSKLPERVKKVRFYNSW